LVHLIACKNNQEWASNRIENDVILGRHQSNLFEDLGGRRHLGDKRQLQILDDPQGLRSRFAPLTGLLRGHFLVDIDHQAMI
jgi:hypothetical protein